LLGDGDISMQNGDTSIHARVTPRAAAHEPPQPTPAATRATTNGWGTAGVCALLLVTPYEQLAPLLRLPGQSISNLEVVIAAVLAAWTAWAVLTRTRVRLPVGIGLPWTVLLVVFATCALFAPADRANALHMVGRLAVALVIAAFTAAAVTTRAHLERVLAAALVAATGVSLLVVLDHLRVPPVVAWLGAFRSGSAVVGGVLRASGPFQYPTIAAMWLEVAFALGTGALLSSIAVRRWGRAGLVFVALVVVAEAITLTLTRAGVAAMLASLLVAAACARRGGESRPALIALATLGALVLALFGASRSTELLRARLTSETQEGWHRASFLATGHVRVRARESTLVDVRVRNDGGVTWDSTADPPYYLSYHWLEADSGRIVHFEGRRTAFPAPVAPGETVTVSAIVEGPPTPGRYQLAWDIVLEHRLWFSTEPGAARAAVIADVDGAATASPPATRDRLPYPSTAVRPGRITLWRAALDMVRDRPWLGVGPDNFRLRYGPYAGIANADARIHSNNLYVEWLAGGGLVGALAAAWFLWRASRTAVAAARTAGAAPAAAGVLAAWVAVLIHGLVDTFFTFTPTYVVIALALGLAAAPLAWEEGGHADPL
jgi:hypothetical protein